MENPEFRANVTLDNVVVSAKPVWRGVITVLFTPFTSRGPIDGPALAAEVDFAVACGVQGLAFPGIASEAAYLSTDERRRGLEVVVDCSQHRVPVLAGVSGSNARDAVALARHATETGADGLMVMAPDRLPGDDGDVLSYFSAVADTSPLPLLLQSAPAPLGSPLTATELTELLRLLPTARYLKQELAPTPHRVAAAHDAFGTRLDGIFGGAGGLHAVEEFCRGASGSMPGPHLADIAVGVWQALASGNEPAARNLHKALLPALVRAQLLGPRFGKAVLVRRGVFASDRVRSGGSAPDAHDDRELAIILDELRPFLLGPH